MHAPSTSEFVVSIVEDSTDQRLFMKQLLDESPGLRCAGCYHCAADALATIPTTAVHLVLMDIRLGSMTGIECTRRLKRLVPGVKVLMVSGLSDPETVREAMAAGGDGYLVKPFTPPQFIAQIWSTLQSSVQVIPGPKSKAVLTPRQDEIMMWLDAGLLYKEIALKLGISFSAVHKHQNKAFRRLRATNRTEACRAWKSLHPSGS